MTKASWLGIPELVNPDAKHCFKEGLGNFFVAEYHSKHEPVRNGELFKRRAFCFHCSFNAGTPLRRQIELSLSTYKTDLPPEICRKTLFTCVFFLNVVGLSPLNIKKPRPSLQDVGDC